MLSDLRYAIRTLRKRPGFTAVAVLTLAIGIGANTTIFGVVNAVLLRPLPFANPDQLVRVYALRDADRWTASPPDYVDWRRDNGTLSDMAALYPQNFALTGTSGGATQVSGAVVTASMFPLLGFAPALGAGFTGEHETLGNHRVVMLSDGLWRGRFGGDSTVVGQSIVLNSERHVVIGVMPADVGFPRDAELWTPLAFSEDDLATQRGAHYLTVLGRLKPGESVERAAADLQRLATTIAEFYPRSNAGWSATVVGMRDAMVSRIRPALMILFAAVGLVLLVACVNVANLMLARAVGRDRELAIRTALGAPRGRLIRVLMTESLVLGIAGGAAGLFLAIWGTSLIASLQVSGIPRIDEVRVDGIVLAFTTGLSVLAGTMFGILPALQGSLFHDVNRRLKDTGRVNTPSIGRGRTKHALVVTEIALALTLVIAAGLLVRSFVHLTKVNPGFQPDQVLTFNISLPESRYDAAHESERFFAQLMDGIRALPGVERAGAVFGLPMSGFSYSLSTYELDGRRLEPPEDDRLSTQIRIATPEYFETLEIPVLRGRGITEADRADAPPVVVVNESAAQLLWPGEDPLARQVVIGTSFGLGRGRAGGTVVGVIGDIRDQGLDEVARPQIYLSHRQFPIDFMTIAARSSGDPTLLIEPIRNLVAALDVEVPVYRVRPMPILVQDSIAEQRFYMRALGVFAVIALVLAAIGIYGVMAYGVAQRTGEIGIRLALGAARTEVLSLIVGQGMRIAALGVGLGLLGAFVATRLMAAVLYGVSPTDGVTFVAAAAVLWVAALLACYLPARRATRVDPMEALRYE